MKSAATTAIAKNTYRTLHICGSLLKSAQGTAPTSPKCESHSAPSLLIHQPQQRLRCIKQAWHCPCSHASCRDKPPPSRSLSRWNAISARRSSPMSEPSLARRACWPDSRLPAGPAMAQLAAESLARCQHDQQERCRQAMSSCTQKFV